MAQNPRYCLLGRRGASRSQKGQSLIEVALLMPILLIILAGIVDLGRAYMTLVALRDAAAEGATYASLHPANTAQIKARTADATSALVTLEEDQVTVQYNDPPTPGLPVTVTVTYEYKLLTPVLNAIVPEGKLDIRAQEVRSIITD